MKMVAIVLAAITITSCAMKNDEIIAEEKKCYDAGFDAVQMRNEFGTMRVECVIKQRVQQ